MSHAGVAAHALPPHRSSPIIDFHAHVLDSYVYGRGANQNVVTGFGARPAVLRPGVLEAMTRPEVQIASMDARGVDIHVISSPTVIQGTAWADPATELELCCRVNDTIASWVAKFPDRFVGTFVLPLQDLDLAITEMRRCAHDLGMVVANLPANVHGRYLGHPHWWPFWEAAESLGIVAYIHPDGVKDIWYQDFSLWNSLGQSIEETKVMASLIYEGTLDRFPNVAMVMAHGGGYFPHYTGRLDRNATHQPQTMKNIKAKPSEYLSRFYYDTCVYDPDVVHALVRHVGVGRLVMGSDFLVNMADPVTFLEGVTGLSGSDFNQVGSTTAAGLLKAALHRAPAS